MMLYVFPLDVKNCICVQLWCVAVWKWRFDSTEGCRFFSFGAVTLIEVNVHRKICHLNPILSFFQSLMLVTVQCMCDLLTSVPHFNFHTNLIAVLVPRMNEKSLDGKVRQHKLSIMNIVIIVFIVSIRMNLVVSETSFSISTHVVSNNQFYN